VGIKRAMVHLADDQPCVACGYCERARCGVEAPHNVTMNTDEVTCNRCLLLAGMDERKRRAQTPAE